MRKFRYVKPSWTKNIAILPCVVAVRPYSLSCRRSGYKSRAALSIPLVQRAYSPSAPALQAGQAHLRTTLSRSQSGVAEILGISLISTGEWDRGHSVDMNQDRLGVERQSTRPKKFRRWGRTRGDADDYMASGYVRNDTQPCTSSSASLQRACTFWWWLMKGLPSFYRPDVAGRIRCTVLRKSLRLAGNLEGNGRSRLTPASGIR